MLTAAWQPSSPAPNRRAASRWPYSSSCMPAAALCMPILSCLHHFQGPFVTRLLRVYNNIIPGCHVRRP